MNRVLDVRLFAIFFSLSSGAVLATDYTVKIEGMKFLPDHLVVKKGDHITWINKDIFPHTATALNQAFHSKTIPPGKSWTFQANKAGTFPYQCKFHPPMKGSLIVNQ